jgi:hypothetical protein
MASVLAGAAPAAESHFFKDVTVQAGDTLRGDLSLYRGNLTVQGVIDGSVSVLFGNCKLDSLGAVTGNLVVVQGKLDLHDPGQVGGKISQKDFLQSASQEAGTPFTMEPMELGSDSTEISGDTKERGKDWDKEDDDLFLSFNRVAGLQLGIKFPTGRAPIQSYKFADLTGHAAWAFGSKRPEWRLKLRRRLHEGSTLYLAAGLHRLSDTQDTWMLTSAENALAGWLLKQDYQDFYDNRGYQIELGGYLLDDRLQVNLGAFRERYGPLDVGTQWNWAANDRPYRVNLFSDSLGYPRAHNQGLRGGIDLRLWGDAQEKDGVWRKGCGLALNWEKGLSRGGYDFAYRRLLANLRFSVPIGSGHREHVNGRLLAGSQSGELPLQYYFRLGGPDALPGFRPKSIDLFNDRPETAGMADLMSSRLRDEQGTPLGGRSMLLLSLENRLAGKGLNFWPLDHWDLLLMADVGQVGRGGLGSLKSDDYRADFGFGIAEDDDDFKLALFRATDSGEADWRLLCRVQRRF